VARRLQITPSTVSKAMIRGRSDPSCEIIWQTVVDNAAFRKFS
jgi:hypothetical protein